MLRQRNITAAVTAIALLVVGGLIFALLAGCSNYASRSVRGEVLAMPTNRDTPTPDLLITNWAWDQDGGTLYVTYAVRAGKRWDVRWEHEMEDVDGWYSPRAAFDEDRVYYVAGDRLLALDRADGTVAWQAPLSDLMATHCPNCIQMAGEWVIVLTTDYILQGVYTRTGDLAWSVRLNHPSTAYDGFSVIDGQIVVYDRKGPEDTTWVLHLFDPATGALVRQIAPTCPDPQQYVRLNEEVVVDRALGQAIFWHECDTDPYVGSWDLARGQAVWHEPLPEEADTSVDWFLLGADTLYADTYKGLFGVSLADGQVEHLVTEIDPDYDWQPLAEHEGLLVGQAQRTRGTRRYELWGVDLEGTRVWRYGMETDSLLDVDSGSADWLYHLVSGGILVVQVLDDPARVTAVMLDPQTGEVLHESVVEMEYASLDGASRHGKHIYLTLDGGLYSVDLETTEITSEWP